MTTPPQSAAAPTLNFPLKLPTYLHFSDLQGLAQLATQGVLGVAGLAEHVQGNVYKTVAAPFGSLGARFVDHAPGASGVKALGITGIVYGGVKAVTRLAGGTVNAALAGAGAVLQKPGSLRPTSPEREAVRSAINGVLGDQLVATANPLAIAMSFRVGGQTVALDAGSVQRAFPNATGKLLLVIHGLCMNDVQWEGHATSHAQVLAQQRGYTPVHLHYNTGLHISDNGERLAELLGALLTLWPEPLAELSVLAHSMGGLVTRAACASAEQKNLDWRKSLKNIVFLGTPHHGAPLERLGNWVDTVLGSNVVTRPFAAIGQIRSSGITDLRYGNVLASSWESTDRFERLPDSREPLPLPQGVHCYSVAASTASKTGSGPRGLPGDGLVSVASAFGEHAEPRHCLAFDPEKQWTAFGMNHLDLLKRPEVTEQLLVWL
jgi:pimeloyl-ACP methyl ester carboxylesterase